MANKMLIDAAHREETRVAVVRGTKIEEFDFESANRKQLRGNIYLAKITRVEPSLQAAFVEYGGNRHGFLAFSEIHPDYYQIPVADKQALIAQDTADEIAAEAEEEAREARGAGKSSGKKKKQEAEKGDGDGDAENGEKGHDPAEINGNGNDEEVESVGTEDALEELPDRPRHRWRSYKIQEVIKKNQVILVQVVKEERGKKGAALTTYLSLAGRHCVLMPNTARGGGISRKITNPADRRRLRDIAQNLNITEGTGLIIRTAGENRTKVEITRDFNYLQRLWETVRTLTLDSSAPSLVYEEGSLIKRSIRDLYNKEIDEIIVGGEAGYKEAKAFMRMLMPSHAKNVKLHDGERPVFTHHQVERQLDALYDPIVTLKSGGYLVINQTEALVAIDINSGKATRERHIEDTALNTNLEAASEIVRQLRLRDLAGLIVIDFIDMEQRRNNRAVERRLKDSLKGDRARIQVGRISHFGLLEMSRQRLRAGVLEGSTAPCPICEGRGFVRSVESSALQVLRAIDEKLLERRKTSLLVRAPNDVAFYMLNKKRDRLREIEEQYGLAVFVEADPDLPNSNYTISRLSEDHADHIVQDASASAQVGAAIQTEAGEEERQDEAPRSKRRRRGGRGRKGRSVSTEASGGESETVEAQTADTAADTPGDTASDDGDEGEETKKAPRRRRGRRGGRRVQQRRSAQEIAAETTPEETVSEPPQPETPAETAAPASESPALDESTPVTETGPARDDAEGDSEKPKSKRRSPRAKSKAKSAGDDAVSEKTEKRKRPERRKKAAGKKANADQPAADIEPARGGETAPRGDDKPAAKKPARRRKSKTADAVEADAGSSDGPQGRPASLPDQTDGQGEADVAAPAGPARKGWWQRGRAAS